MVTWPWKPKKRILNPQVRGSIFFNLKSNEFMISSPNCVWFPRINNVIIFLALYLHNFQKN